jgi:RHS repeat-associated protein
VRRTQKFEYDAWGRLKKGYTWDLSQQGTWRLEWEYDRFGNRRTQALTGGQASITQPQLEISETTNRITTPGYAYDAAGNMTNDSLHAYTFDAENRIKTVDGTEATYTYSGPTRLKKADKSGTTVYIYSGSKVIAEYANGSLSKEYVYWGSTLLATHEGSGSTLRYHHPDHLSTRVETLQSKSGPVIARTYGQYPFGETWYESGMSNNWKFTSYERDQESGLDYAMFRYYSPRMGRFMSADLVAGFLWSPQSLNRYSYVGNDPANSTDPLGLFCPYPPGCNPPPPPPDIPGGVTLGDVLQLWGMLGGGVRQPLQDVDGGGGGSVSVTNVTAAGKKIQTALDALLRKLQQDPECQKFLAGAGTNAVRDFSFWANRVGQGNIEVNGDKKSTGAVTPPPKEVPGGYITIVNNNGGFFKDVNGRDPINPGMANPIMGGGPRAETFILLHELAHASGVFLHDLNNSDAQKANNQMLEKNCAKTLGTGK